MNEKNEISAALNSGGQLDDGIGPNAEIAQTTAGNIAVVGDPERLLLLCDITLDPRAQPREGMNQGVVAEYTTLMNDGHAFPPVDVFEENTSGGMAYFLADGWHRFRAAERAGHLEIAAHIHMPYNNETALRSAILHAIGANAEHGLRRSNGDKRRAVLMLLDDEYWSKFSNRNLANLANVSEGLVRKIFAENEDHLRIYADAESPKIVKFARGGKVHKQKRRKSATKKKVVAENKPAAKSSTNAEKMAESISAVDIDLEARDAVADAVPVDPAAAIRDIPQIQSVGGKLDQVNETMQSLPLDPKEAFAEACDEGQWMKWKDAQHWSSWFGKYAQAAREEITR